MCNLELGFHGKRIKLRSITALWMLPQNGTFQSKLRSRRYPKNVLNVSIPVTKNRL